MGVSQLPVEPLDFAFVTIPFLIAAVAAAGWVFIDSGSRGVGGGRLSVRLSWVLATFLLLPIALALYLLVGRPIGDLVTCPTCHRLTLNTRSVCARCASPIAAGAPPTIWGFGDVLGVVLLFVFFIVVVFDATALYGELVSLKAISLFVLVQNALLTALVLYVVRMRYRQPLTALGMQWAPTPPIIALGVVGSVAALPLSALAEGAGRFIIGRFIGPAQAEALAASEQARNHLLAVLRTPLTPGEIAWLFALVCVIVPIGEEIFFRGFIYGVLRARLRLPLAVGSSALLFAVVHTTWFHFLPILILGLILAILYERTRTLLPGIVVHSVNNVVALLAVLYRWDL